MTTYHNVLYLPSTTPFTLIRLDFNVNSPLYAAIITGDALSIVTILGHVINEHVASYPGIAPALLIRVASTGGASEEHTVFSRAPTNERIAASVTDVLSFSSNFDQVSHDEFIRLVGEVAESVKRANFLSRRVAVAFMSALVQLAKMYHFDGAQFDHVGLASNIFEQLEEHIAKFYLENTPHSRPCAAPAA